MGTCTRCRRRSSSTTRFSGGLLHAGQVMSAVACIAEGHTGSDEEIAEFMSGNICRCAAYPQIRAAIAADGSELSVVETFAFAEASTLDEALALLAEPGTRHRRWHRARELAQGGIETPIASST